MKSLNSAEIIVPKAITIDIIPAVEMGTPISIYIVGQAAPRRPSGSPRLINAT